MSLRFRCKDVSCTGVCVNVKPQLAIECASQGQLLAHLTDSPQGSACPPFQCYTVTNTANPTAAASLLALAGGPLRQQCCSITCGQACLLVPHLQADTYAACERQMILGSCCYLANIHVVLLCVGDLAKRSSQNIKQASQVRHIVLEADYN
jgi:hypothetical protein